MNVHGYEFIWPDWKNNSSSKTAKTQKGGKVYFLKRYANPVAPINNGSLTPKAMEKNQRRFDKFVEIRSGINKEIRKFAASGGDIIIPADEFIDGNAYVEASEWIDNKVDDDEVEGVVNSLPLPVKMNLLLTATGALKTVHAHNIVHSDLKLKNILLVKNMSGTYSAKLIDFDNSYFVGKLPDELVGDIYYYSPELGAYSGLDEEDDDYEANKEACGRNLTTKSDIFSMGLIFHYYLTGEKVKYDDATLHPFLKKRLEKGMAVYPWAVVSTDGKLILSSKLTDPFLKDLVSAMLSKDKENRPDAGEVFMALKLKKLPDKYKSASSTATSTGTSSGMTDPSTGGAPGVARVVVSPASLRLDLNGTKSSTLTASVAASGGAATTVTWTSSNAAVATVNASGMVTAIAVGNATITATSTVDGTKKGMCSINVITTGVTREAKFDEPWPEHEIVFDVEKMKSRGIVGLVREEQHGIKGYGLYNSLTQPTTLFRNKETLVAIGYARKGAPKAVVVEDGDICEPFPEHGIVFDADTIRAKGWASVARDEATKQYKFTAKNGVARLLNVATCIALKLAKRV